MLTVNLLVIASVALELIHQHRREHAEAQVMTQTLARVLEENLTGVIAKIDLTLLAVRDEIDQKGSQDEQRVEQMLTRHSARIPESLGLRVAGADGTIREAVGNVVVNQANIADRPQFIEMRDNPQAGLVISQPVFGRSAQKWIITLSRRLSHPDGSFAGDVHASVALERLSAIFSAIDIGPNGAVSLWNDNPSLIARYAASSGTYPTVGGVTPSPELRHVIETAAITGHYQAKSGADGVLRSFAVRKVGSLPFYVTVGMAEQDYLAPWRKEAFDLIGLSFLFILVTLLAAWLIYRSWRERDLYTQALERVTEQVARERRLNASLLSWAGEGICGIDAQGRLTFINPAASRMLGWEESEILGKSLHDLVHHHHADGTEYPAEDCPTVATLRDGQTHHSADDVYWRKDGAPFAVEFTSTAICDDLGKVIGSVTIFRDITESKANERRLRFFKEVLNHAKDPVQCIDPAQGYLVVLTNPAAEAHFGLPMEQLLKMRVADWHQDDSDAFCQEIEKRLENEGTVVFETEHLTARGLVPVEINLTGAVVDDHPYWIAIIRDMSERKRIEAQMAQHLATTEVISAILRLSLQDLPLEQILGTALDAILALPWLTLERRGAIFLIDPKTTRLVMTAQRNLPAELCEDCAAVAVGRCLCGDAASGDELICRDPRHEDGFEGMPDHGHYCLPIGQGSDMVGVLNTYVSRDHHRDEGEERFLRLVADTLAGIIKRRQAEAALRTSEEQARVLMNASSDAALLMDRNGIVLAANETLAARCQSSIGDLIGTVFFDRLPADLAAARRAACDAVIASGKPSHAQDERNGMALDNRTYPVLAANGEVSQLAVFSRDITEQHRHEREIRDLLSYQRAILDNAPIGIAILSRDRRLIQLNQAFGHIFGYRVEDLMGRSSRILYDDDQGYEDIGQRGYPLVEAGEVFVEETAMMRADGSEVWVYMVAHMVDRTDPSLGIVWAAEDITARRALELDLKRSNEELERFAYVASHDLRQPLRVISGHLSIIGRNLRDRLDDDDKASLDFAIDGAKRMDRMIVDLLDYSRIGRQETQKQPVELALVVARAIENLDLFIKEADAEITIPDGLPVVPGYESELERLFQNLISNAVKFRAPDRRPKVVLTCQKKGHEWLIALSDNGIGIAPGDHARLFQVFTRLVSRERYDGNGIGLAACRKIIEHHGGRIWLDSEKDQGSTFHIALPVS